MSLDLSTTRRRAAPVRALVLGVAMTMVLLVLGVTLAWGLYARTQELITRDLKLRTLLGEILRLDEVLSMSARMAAATGDLSWEARYRGSEPQLIAQVEEAARLASPRVQASIAAAAKANRALVELEHRAFELLHDGRHADAAALLASATYAQHQDTYHLAVEETRRSVAREAEQIDHDQRLHVRIVVVASLAIACILAIAWKRIITRILLHRSASAAQRALARANRELDARVKARTAELSETNARLEHSLEKLAATQRELMAASRKAGMAVVASGVLHNVGNVLNSVNVASATAADVIRRMRVDGLRLASELLRGGDAEKARRVPEYLDKLAEHLGESHAQVRGELQSLQKHIDHIKVVIAKQQSNARSMAVLELFDVGELVEDALQFESGSDAREKIEVVVDLAELPIVLGDRHKLTQMVVNLLANARHAVRNHHGEPKIIGVRTRAVGDDRFAIDVEDSGYGIAPENLGRIFEHGFTTKKDGHGFGLHASACDVQEMGGAMRVHSDGVGHGARFTIELPLAPREEKLAAQSVAAASLPATGEAA